MAAAGARLIIDGQRMEELLRSPQGPVFRHLIRVGDKVIVVAKANIKEKTGRDGKLSRSIVKRNFEGPTGPGVAVIAGAGLNPQYASYYHEGNGPEGSFIYPKKPGGVLVFLGRAGAGGQLGPGGAMIFAKKVRTYPGNPFLRKAMEEVVR